MKIESMKLAYTPDITHFFDGARRSATSEEGKGWGSSSDIYEVQVSNGARLKVQHAVEIDRVLVTLEVNGQALCFYEFKGGQFVSEEDGARLVVFCGTFALRIDKNPWRLKAFYSDLYHDFDFDGDDFPY